MKWTMKETKNYQFGWDNEVNFLSQEVGDNSNLTTKLRMFQGNFCVIFRCNVLQLDATIKE